MKILFQGDSITDAGRNTNNGSLITIGQSYPMIIDGALSVKYPGRFTFENYGISGNRSVDVYARVKKDVWNHKPDVLSILLGVNDVWHDLGEEPNGVDAERFYTVYKMLCADTLKALPGCRIMMMEPFVLKESATEADWDFFRTEVALRADAVRRIAGELDQVFVPLQSVLDEAAKVMPAGYWLGDGVHPMPAGHQLIADQWMKVFEKEILNV